MFPVGLWMNLQNSIKKREIKALAKLIEGHKKNPNYKLKRISKNTAYKKGRQFEYRVKKHFEKLGYYVKRSYASKGAEDLIAIKSIDFSHDIKECICSEVLLIQCKNLKVERALSKRECDNLRALALITGGTPLVAMNVHHKLKIEEVDL
jgi:Holliday junction resolvase